MIMRIGNISFFLSAIMGKTRDFMKKVKGISFHHFLVGMRKGKNVTQEELCRGLCSVSMLTRIEKGDRLPDKLMRDRLLARLGISNDGYEDFLQPDEYVLWKDRQELAKAIQDRDCETAEELLSKYYRAPESKNVVERQFYLTMQAQLMRQRRAGEEELRKIYGEALALTVSDGVGVGRTECLSAGRGQDDSEERSSGGRGDRLGRRLLADQEWDLLLEYIYFGGDVGGMCRSGRAQDGWAAAYRELMEAVRATVTDEYACAKIYPKAVFYYCSYMMRQREEEREYENMLAACHDAIEVLRCAGRMYYLCELLEVRETLLASLIRRILGKRRRGRALTADAKSVREADGLQEIRRLERETKEWRAVLTQLYREYGLSERMQGSCYFYIQTENYCIGDVVRIRRQMLGMTQRQLCGGICGEKTLQRLEANRACTHAEIVQGLFERLGMSGEYQRMRIVTDRYEAVRLHRDIMAAGIDYEAERERMLYERLQKIIDMDNPVNRQEMLRIECGNKFISGEYTQREYVIRLKEVLSITILPKNLHRNGKRYLTCVEINCLYNIAMYAEGEEAGRYVKILQEIYCQYVAENGMMTYLPMYSAIMRGVAGYLGNLGRYGESDEIAHTVISECLKTKQMNMLHDLLYSVWWNRMEYSKQNHAEINVENERAELKKCIILSRLCREKLYEAHYLGKMKSLSE